MDYGCVFENIGDEESETIHILTAPTLMQV
jgi:hypothetical protein